MSENMDTTEPSAPPASPQLTGVWTHRCIIVNAQSADLARALCAQLAGASGRNMFADGLSDTGLAPATHYISTGMIDAQFAALLADPVLLAQTCLAAGITLPPTEIQALLDSAEITSDNPAAAIARKGLQIIT